MMVGFLSSVFFPLFESLQRVVWTIFQHLKTKQGNACKWDIMGAAALTLCRDVAGK